MNSYSVFTPLIVTLHVSPTVKVSFAGALSEMVALKEAESVPDVGVGEVHGRSVELFASLAGVRVRRMLSSSES